MVHDILTYIEDCKNFVMKLDIEGTEYKVLDRIRKNKDRDYKTNPFRYDARMRELILTRLVEGYVFEGTEIYPNQNVKKYFNKSIDDYIGEN